MKTFQPLLELHIRLMPACRAWSIALGYAGVGPPKPAWAHPCVWEDHHRMALHSEEAAAPWGSIVFWKLWRQALGLRWWKWKSFVSKHWETSLSWGNIGWGSDSVSAAMLAKRLHHGAASAQKKGENHCLLPRWSLQVTGRKFVCLQLMIGVVH